MTVFDLRFTDEPSDSVTGRELPNHLSCPDCWKRPQRHVGEVSHLCEEKNDRKRNCREEKINRQGRLKIAVITSFESNEPSRTRLGSGRAREAKNLPTVPMNSTADPNSDFP